MRLVHSLFLASLLACGASRGRAPVAAGSQPVRTEQAPPSACGVQADGARVFRVLHLNDVYRIEGLADGRGGLARVRTLREQLEDDCADAVLLTHAGDALYPSLLSREFGGAQMIDVLNYLDGDGQADDALMFATFGNHEFDKSRLDQAPDLQQRVRDSQFTWLDTNITWKKGPEAPYINADTMARDAIVEVGGVQVGIFGLTIDNKIPDYVEAIDTDYIGIARQRSADLRARGAEVVIGLTHLDAGDDADLLATLGQDGPDAVLGGHDHVLMSSEIAGRPLLKGDADAVRVRTLEFRVGPDGAVGWKADKAGVKLGPDTYAPDPVVDERVQTHLDAFDAAFCEGVPDCLAEPLTVAGVRLIAEETQIRRYETNLGDWIADRMRDPFPKADVAVVNSGALRLNQDISEGTTITRQIVEEIFAYPTPMYELEVSGEELQQVLDRSAQDWTGQGHWLQVSGLAFRHDVDASKAVDVHVLGEDGPVPLDPQATYRMVTVNYLIDPEIGDQDGYTMLSKAMVVDVQGNETDLKEHVLDALRALGEQGLAPAREGRICNSTEDAAPCMLAE